MSLKAKLRKLEQMAPKVWKCSLCRGYPMAVWHDPLLPDPNGPGCLHGPITLDPKCRDLLTDDGRRCRRCGESVKQPLILARPTMGVP